MVSILCIGLCESLIGSPPTVTCVTPVVVPTETLGLLLILRAFADGGSAITGVEAVSNGVLAFKKPEARNARTTLVVMGALVGFMFIGVSLLAGISGAVPSPNETAI